MSGGSCGNLRRVRYTAPVCVNADPAHQNPSASGDGISTVAVLTAVLWLGCLVVGAVGFVLPYARPRPPAPLAPTVQARVIKVDLTSETMAAPALVVSPSLNLPQPPPLFSLLVLDSAPQLVAVAQPSPAIVFAVPVEAIARISESKLATSLQPAPPSVQPGNSNAGTAQPRAGNAPAPAPAVQTLTFGIGDGKQPAPKYPEAARRAGQEGTVTIRFTVGDDGRVLAAEPSAPSPWSALNREALRVVREQWRFPSGPARLYEVVIRFELKK